MFFSLLSSQSPQPYFNAGTPTEDPHPNIVTTNVTLGGITPVNGSNVMLGTLGDVILLTLK
jgi:hypothetical protein